MRNVLFSLETDAPLAVAFCMAAYVQGGFRATAERQMRLEFVRAKCCAM